MDLLFKYNQEKIEKGTNQSRCDLKLFYSKDIITYQGSFWLHYKKYGENKQVEFYHQLEVDTKTGDIVVTYKIINELVQPQSNFRNIVIYKKNDFQQFMNLTNSGFFNGEKKIGYWGINYTRAVDRIFDLIYEIIETKISNKYFKDKPYKHKHICNSLYDLIVDFHLDRKGIKSHNSVYTHIQYDYPKKKWLKKNDYKFLPAILDQYGIKSKYLIKELNDTPQSIQISSLKYLCKLFGENYVDYLKQIDWKELCYELPDNKKLHILKSESEKKCMINLINKWEKNGLYKDSFIYSINNLLSTREFLESVGHELKFKINNDREFQHITEVWGGLKNHINKGYKMKYSLDPEFISLIEEDIIHEDGVYKPKVILSEQDFRMEGYVMKNCMAKQFDQGAIFIYVSLRHKRKQINTQFRKGRLIQSLGKANTPVPKNFKEPIKILSSRMATRPDIQWKREKYDFIK